MTANVMEGRSENGTSLVNTEVSSTGTIQDGNYYKHHEH